MASILFAISHVFWATVAWESPPAGPPLPLAILSNFFQIWGKYLECYFDSLSQRKLITNNVVLAPVKPFHPSINHWVSLLPKMISSYLVSYLKLPWINPKQEPQFFDWGKQWFDWMLNSRFSPGENFRILLFLLSLLRLTFSRIGRFSMIASFLFSA